MSSTVPNRDSMHADRWDRELKTSSVACWELSREMRRVLPMSAKDQERRRVGSSAAGVVDSSSSFAHRVVVLFSFILESDWVGKKVYGAVLCYAIGTDNWHACT